MPSMPMSVPMSEIKQQKSVSRDQKSVNEVIVEPINNDFFDA